MLWQHCNKHAAGNVVFDGAMYLGASRKDERMPFCSNFVVIAGSKKFT